MQDALESALQWVIGEEPCPDAMVPLLQLVNTNAVISQYVQHQLANVQLKDGMVADVKMDKDFRKSMMVTEAMKPFAAWLEQEINCGQGEGRWILLGLNVASELKDGTPCHKESRVVLFLRKGGVILMGFWNAIKDFKSSLPHDLYGYVGWKFLDRFHEFRSMQNFPAPMGQSSIGNIFVLPATEDGMCTALTWIRRLITPFDAFDLNVTVSDLRDIIRGCSITCAWSNDGSNRPNREFRPPSISAPPLSEKADYSFRTNLQFLVIHLGVRGGEKMHTQHRLLSFQKHQLLDDSKASRDISAKVRARNAVQYEYETTGIAFSHVAASSCAHIVHKTTP